MKTNLSLEKGQIIIGVMAVLIVLLLVIPMLINWNQTEARWANKQLRNTTAYNLAEGAVDRAVWKLKSSTSTWDQARLGQALAGYQYDATYNDIPGGLYRITLSSGPANYQVTIRAEGKDQATKQVRAIKAVYQNTTLPGPLLSGGIINYNATFEVHWGPVMAQNNINITGDAALEFFPRKFSRQTVTGTAGNPRDTNGLTPPNTDNVEWWSDYDVPDVPLLDFATMRSSAQANGTLNFFTTSGAQGAGKCIGWAGAGRCETGTNSWANHVGKPHFFNSNEHALSKRNLIWYWDNDVIFTGNFDAGGCHRLGLWGTVIVRGNLTMDSGDCYAFNGNVPTDAWKEYTKIKGATVDTNAINQYPADNGLRTNRATFNFGAETWTGGPLAGDSDVAFRGLVYVGGNMTINAGAKGDMAGVAWVVGNVTNNNGAERNLVFYQDNLQVPTLNVVLQRITFEEISPSTTTWM